MGAVIPAGMGSGNTVYAQISSALTGDVWDGTALVPYSQASWSQYVNLMPEQTNSGRYLLTVPGGLPNGRYFISVYYCSVNPPTPTLGDNIYDFSWFDFKYGNALGLGSGLNMTEINSSEVAAENLAISAAAMATGNAQAGTLTTSQMTTNLASAITNVYAGRVIVFTSGGNLGRAALITAYTVSGGKLTFVAYNNLPITVAPSPGDSFIII